MHTRLPRNMQAHLSVQPIVTYIVVYKMLKVLNQPFRGSRKPPLTLILTDYNNLENKIILIFNREIFKSPVNAIDRYTTDRFLSSGTLYTFLINSRPRSALLDALFSCTRLWSLLAQPQSRFFWQSKEQPNNDRRSFQFPSQERPTVTTHSQRKRNTLIVRWWREKEKKLKD